MNKASYCHLKNLEAVSVAVVLGRQRGDDPKHHDVVVLGFAYIIERILDAFSPGISVFPGSHGRTLVRLGEKTLTYFPKFAT